MISFNHNYLPKGSIFKYCHIGEGELELHHMNLGQGVGQGHNSVHNNGVMCYYETKEL